MSDSRAWMLSEVRYRADGWGIGRLVFRAHELAWAEHPSRPDDDSFVSLTNHPLARRFEAYFRGERIAFEDVPLDLGWCTPFQLAVAGALRAIPYGETVTYGELAALAGHPGAQRAVGTFCARNRFALVLPCHRVVAADAIGPYGSLGVEYKRRLLELEGALD